MTKQDIYHALAALPDVYPQSNIQLQTKCFLCGDSKKNPNKKRLGIKITEDPKEPIIYNCFNCFEHGVFTVDMLHEMGIYDQNMDIFLQKLNNSAYLDDGTKTNRYKNTKEVPIQLPELRNDKKSLAKVKYVYNRIGYKIPLEDFAQLKLVWSLWDLIDLNKIGYDPKDISKINIFDEYYVGALTLNNDYVVLRDITDNPELRRYDKYNLFDTIDNSNSYYMMRARADILSENQIDIIIAEGLFDVLGIKYNLFHGDVENKLYVAVCNGSFTSPLLNIFKKGFVGDNIHVHVYQDNDTRMDFRKLRREVTPYILNPTHFCVYYNTLSKDFGVPSSKIQVDTLLI